MDFTPARQRLPSLTASTAKLPIKRKTPESSSSPNPSPDSPAIVTPKLESASTTTTDGTAEYGIFDDDDRTGLRPPSFKFHRIWTEPDEIRFLQGLLDCSSEGLSFPRDLNAFYSRFSGTMSQPYTKSQLSEKLRRLRKKFRVMSTRLSKGLDSVMLSPHDRALYELSKKLWHPDFLSSSPFSVSGTNNHKANDSSHLVGVKVSFAPTLPPSSVLFPEETRVRKFDEDPNLNCIENDTDHGGDAKLSEVNVKFEDGDEQDEMEVLRASNTGGFEQIAARVMVDVFDQCLNEVRINKGSRSDNCLEEAEDLEKRWQEQRVAEMDVLSRRLRLVVEDSLPRL